MVADARSPRWRHLRVASDSVARGGVEVEVLPITAKALAHLHDLPIRPAVGFIALTASWAFRRLSALIVDELDANTAWVIIRRKRTDRPAATDQSSR